ncbi:uncharacterized protein LOC134760747 [Pongo abelii]|uniref:uncharacterized protein LOC134760747 n=1 Tax=Pongo abelii TaxID=9601 RepID=UPI0030064D4B
MIVSLSKPLSARLGRCGDPGALGFHSCLGQGSFLDLCGPTDGCVVGPGRAGGKATVLDVCLLGKAVSHATRTSSLVLGGRRVPLLLGKEPCSTESSGCHGCQGAKGTGFCWVQGRWRQGYLPGGGVVVGCSLWKPLGPSGRLPECGLDSGAGPVSQAFRCAWLFFSFVAEVSRGPPGARLDITVRLAIAPYGLKDTRWLHLLLGDVGATCGHTGSISDSPLSVFARVGGSSVGMPEPPLGLGDEGGPLLHPGRREAVGSWVSSFSADSTPCGPGDLSVPQRDPSRLTALQPHSPSPGGIHRRIRRGVRTAQPAP